VSLILQGDALTQLRTLPDESVAWDWIAASPLKARTKLPPRWRKEAFR
jgi:hypothetical protein